MAHQNVEVGSVVIVKEGIGVVKYIGQVNFDEPDQIYVGVEIKGSDVTIKPSTKYDIADYIKSNNKNCVLRKKRSIIKVLTNEEMVNKMSFLYDILSGKKPNLFQPQFIHISSYYELQKNYEKLEETNKTLQQENTYLTTKINVLQNIDMKSKVNQEIIDTKTELKIDSCMFHILIENNLKIIYSYIYTHSNISRKYI